MPAKANNQKYNGYFNNYYNIIYYRKLRHIQIRSKVSISTINMRQVDETVHVYVDITYRF